jgi:quinol monooxygenase YgiN
MLIIAGTITVDPDDREKFLALRRDTVAAARQMKGCLEYAFSADIVDPSCVRLFERWESEDDVAAWMMAHRSDRRDSGEPEVSIRRMDFLKHQISSTGPIDTLVGGDR